MKRKGLIRAFLLLLAATLICVPCFVIVVQIHQMRSEQNLIRAIKQQNLPAVQSLLHAGVDANTREKPPLSGSVLDLFLYFLRHGRPKPAPDAPSALMLAVQEGNTPITLALLSAGAKDVNARIHFYGSINGPLLVYASQEGYTRIVKALLDKGADIEACDDNKITPLLAAASWNTSNDQNYHPLSDAAKKLAQQRQTNLVGLLLEHGANVHATDSQGISALSRLAEDDERATSLLLLEHGADPNAGHDEWTPLNWAAYYDDLVLAKALVKHGARVELPGTDPAIIEAPSADMLAFLLHHGAHIDARSIRGKHEDETALMQASWADDFEAVRFLVSRGANVNAVSGGQDYYPHTALTFAAQYADTRIVHYLLNHGARLDRNKHALYWAVYDGNFDTARLLLAHGADPNGDNPPPLDDESLPLMQTAEWGDEDFARTLLRKGANVNARDSEGSTALIVAAADNNAEMVALLLAWGARVNVKDKNGVTPLKAALANDEDNTGEVAALLRRAGAK